MKTMAVISLVIIAAVIAFILFLSHYGLFADVTIDKKKTGPFLLVYKKHTGDYKNVGPVMDRLYFDLKDNYGIETTKGFGLYYDNPREVAKDKLRSIVGCIVESRSADELSAVAASYGVKEFPASESIVAAFPYKGKPSIILGVLKVYPRLTAYISEHNHPSTPIMEIYDQPNKKVEYISAVSLSQEIFDDFLK